LILFEDEGVMMKFVALIFSLLLTACSTVPVYVAPQTGTKVIVARDSGFRAAGCSFVIKINGEQRGVIEAGQVMTFPVQSGNHKINISTGSYAGGISSLCPNITTTRMTVVEKSPIVFRIGFDANSQLYFDQIE
jgi:hypothetical protein